MMPIEQNVTLLFNDFYMYVAGRRRASNSRLAGYKACSPTMPGRTINCAIS